MFFTENAMHRGSGKDSLVAEEMYRKIIEFKKKWRNLRFLASVSIFFHVLNETSHLLYLMEADTVTIYQIQEAVEDTVLNLNDIAEEEETTLFPMNVEIIKEAEESNNFLMANSVTVSVSASNVPAQ